MRKKIMSLESILPVIVAGLYFATGLIHAGKGEWHAMGLWVSYAFGNVFIVMMSSK